MSSDDSDTRLSDDFTLLIILQPSWRRTFAGFVRVARNV